MQARWVGTGHRWELGVGTGPRGGARRWRLGVRAPALRGYLAVSAGQAQGGIPYPPGGIDRTVMREPYRVRVSSRFDDRKADAAHDWPAELASFAAADSFSLRMLSRNSLEKPSSSNDEGSKGLNPN